jgi:hypothetical protein
MWSTLYFREKAFARFEPYIAHYLERGNTANYDLIMAKIVDTVRHYLDLLTQSFGDLDKARIAELRLLKLV